MYTLYPANQREQTVTDTFSRYHSFDNRDVVGFGDLQALNDDILIPSQNLNIPLTDKMETFLIPVNGKIKYQDSLGNKSVLKPGDVQKLSADGKTSLTAANPSKSKPVRFLQIWIAPHRAKDDFAYEQKSYIPQIMSDQLKLIVSPDGRDDSLTINQDAEIYQCLLNENKTVTFNIDEKRKAWIQNIYGNISVNGHIIIAGDGLAIEDENAIVEIRGIDKQSNFLIFNLKN